MPSPITAFITIKVEASLLILSDFRAKQVRLVDTGAGWGT